MYKILLWKKKMINLTRSFIIKVPFEKKYWININNNEPQGIRIHTLK